MIQGRGHGALVAALTFFLVLLAGLHQLAVRYAGGSFTYPLDDTYIHLAMAKHFAQGQGWGISAGHFASSSSSPLWTLLLSAWMGVFGTGDEAPLLLATLFGLAAVVIAYRALRQHATTPDLVWIALVLAIVSAPLATLSLSGLEHALQTALALAFLAECADQLSGAPTHMGNRMRLIALAFLLGGVRYESLLLVGCACLLFAVRGSLRFAIVLGLAAVAPVVAYGLWSMAHGWYFFPNSVLLKANIPSGASADFTTETAFGALFRSPHLMVLMAGAAVLMILADRAGRRWTWSQVALGMFLGAAVLHLGLARIGWLFRYEAYLVFMGVVVIAIGLDDMRGRLWRPQGPLAWRALCLAALVLAVLPLAHRGVAALRKTPLASKNIHDQQYQMGTFLARYYPGAGVAANDVGAIAFLGEARVLDLFGLADLDVGRRKLSRTWDRQAIHDLAQERGVKVAVVYDEWFARMGGVPREWMPAGEWTIARNVVCGSARVAWYAVDPAESAPLMQHLRDFASRLPPDVAQDGPYRRP